MIVRLTQKLNMRRQHFRPRPNSEMRACHQRSNLHLHIYVFNDRIRSTLRDRLHSIHHADLTSVAFPHHQGQVIVQVNV